MADYRQSMHAGERLTKSEGQQWLAVSFHIPKPHKPEEKRQGFAKPLNSISIQGKRRQGLLDTRMSCEEVTKTTDHTPQNKDV